MLNLTRYDIFFIDSEGDENEDVIESEATHGKWVKFDDVVAQNSTSTNKQRV